MKARGKEVNGGERDKNKERKTKKGREKRKNTGGRERIKKAGKEGRGWKGDEEKG